VETVTNKFFDDEIVYVDNNAFIGCSFSEVTLVYTGGVLPEFTNCQFDSVALRFEDTASKTLKFLSDLPDLGFSGALDDVVQSIRAGTVE